MNKLSKTGNNYIMLNMFIRSIIIYVFVLIVIRLMGKRQVGEMQPFEFVITLILADLACIPMAELAVPLLHGIIPIFTLLLLHFILCFLSRKSMRARYIISGRSTVIISPKGIDYKELRKLNMNLDDLIESLRGKDIFNIEEVAYAIMETNGQMSIITRASMEPPTREDMQIKTQPNALPVAIIMDGKTMNENINMTGVSESFIQNCLTKANVEKIKDVLILTLDNNGKVFIQPKYKSFFTFETDFKGGANW